MEFDVIDQQLAEHPVATTTRLKQIGKWHDAERLLRKIKEQHRRRFKKRGGPMTLAQRVEMTKAAWDAVHQQWPAPEGTEPLASLIEYLQSTRGSSCKGDLPPLTAEAEARFNEIGETDDITDEVLWVYHNIDKTSVDSLDCPSRGAWSLLAHAREDREAFYRHHLKQAVAEIGKRKAKGDGAYEYTPSKAEKLAVADLQRMILEAVEDSQRDDGNYSWRSSNANGAGAPHQ